jgi:hypothetical protein
MPQLRLYHDKTSNNQALISTATSGADSSSDETSVDPTGNCSFTSSSLFLLSYSLKKHARQTGLYISAPPIS